MLFFLCAILSIALPPIPSAQAAAPNAAAEQASPNEADVLCLPGVQLIEPDDCLPLGPSQYRNEMAAIGISLPLIPLPARAIDPDLAIVPYLYATLKAEDTPIYGSLEDAVAGKNPIGTIASGGLKYISYINYAETDNGRFFERRGGGWVRVESRVGIPRSYLGGLEFTRTPMNSFGWILPLQPSIATKRTPGYAEENYTAHLLNQYQMVQIYAMQVVDEAEWYMVGPDEWIDQRFIGRVVPNTTPPEGVTNGRWIEINLFEQTLMVYENNQLVYATLIASGLEPFYTRPGLFNIYKKLESGPMSGAFEADRSDFYYLEDVPWTMYYDQARALHGAYWRTAFGFPQSHGCVNLAPGDAHWLYNWSLDGDWVYIWDPSGKTPTDPAYYNEGGA